MKIAVVDVAAEKSGGLSVLRDFYNFLLSSESAKNNTWTLFTSVVDFEEAEHIAIEKNIWIKKSWLHRIYWELFVCPKKIGSANYDLIISMQNTAVLRVKVKQIVYFHNVLLTQKTYKFSFFKSIERKFWIYQNIVGPLTRLTLKKSWKIIAQTETVKKQLLTYDKNFNITVIQPNIGLINTAMTKKNLNLKKTSEMIHKFIYPATPMPFKNHLKIIEASEILIRDYKIIDFIVYFTIDGKENSYSEQLKERCKHLKQIEFIGFLSRDSVFDYYRECSLLQLSSIESFPIPIVEAIQFSSAIIALPYDYSKEILKGYNKTIMCDDISSVSLAKGIKYFIDNSISIFEIANSKIHVESESTWNILLKTLNS